MNIKHRHLTHLQLKLFITSAGGCDESRKSTRLLCQLKLLRHFCSPTSVFQNKTSQKESWQEPGNEHQ